MIEKFLSGWTSPAPRQECRRGDEIPKKFMTETVKGNSLCAAWGEAGYLDPEEDQLLREPGCRYWQGFAKPAFLARSGKSAHG